MNYLLKKGNGCVFLLNKRTACGVIAIMKCVVLKKGKERAIAHRHPWIFSGAIQRIDDDIPDGSIAPIADHAGTILAWGYINRASQITS